MFRNTELLKRSRKMAATAVTSDSRPISIVAVPSESEAVFLGSLLNELGFRAIHAPDGKTALDMAMQRDTQLLVAALDITGIDAFEVCRKVREHRADVPIILIGPEGSARDQLSAHENSFNGYVQRPLNLEDSESQIRALLRSPNPPLRTSSLPLRSAPAQPVVDLKPAAPRFSVPDSRRPEQIVAVKEAGDEVASFEDETLSEIIHADYLNERNIRQQVALLYKEAFEFLSASIRRLERGEKLLMKEGLEIAKRIVRSMQDDKGLLVLAMDRTPVYSFRQHSVNVGIAGSRIASTLKLPEERLSRVCLAGLLHDIGSVKLPRKLTGKYSGFSAAERAEMQRRPLYSAQLVSGYAGFEWLPEIVAQVHEREDGSGYPHGLKSRDICEEAKILCVADVFEACIHTRPQRPAMTGYKALEIMTSQAETFSERVTKAMIRSFSVYPFNEFVLLSTGEIAQVIDINPENPLRPLIRILYSVEGEPVSTDRIINLAKNAQLWITFAITPDELPQKV
jgi:HD-GYP domain-containing protein (c-di-GMP phosphodiesterase class II)